MMFCKVLHPSIYSRTPIRAGKPSFGGKFVVFLRFKGFKSFYFIFEGFSRFNVRHYA